jgi:hypothetical protein
VEQRSTLMQVCEMNFVPELRLAISQQIRDGVHFFRLQRIKGENILPFVEN